MPIRKIIVENKKQVCLSPEHNPPTHIVLEPGSTYEYECPSCGQKTIINTPLISF